MFNSHADTLEVGVCLPEKTCPPKEILAPPTSLLELVINPSFEERCHCKHTGVPAISSSSLWNRIYFGPLASLFWEHNTRFSPVVELHASSSKAAGMSHRSCDQKYGAVMETLRADEIWRLERVCMCGSLPAHADSSTSSPRSITEYSKSKLCLFLLSKLSRPVLNQRNPTSSSAPSRELSPSSQPRCWQTDKRPACVSLTQDVLTALFLGLQGSTVGPEGRRSCIISSSTPARSQRRSSACQLSLPSDPFIGSFLLWTPIFLF